MLLVGRVGVNGDGSRFEPSQHGRLSFGLLAFAEAVEALLHALHTGADHAA